MKTGKVYIIGAGPGDPGLITVRGQEILSRADVIVYDSLVGPEILKMGKPDAVLFYVGKKPGRHLVPQADIQKILEKQAKAGKSVVRLKGGDPSIFARVGEEITYLSKRKIAFEIVPGVTASLAAAACAGIPLTHREISSTLSVLTGHEDTEKHEFRVAFKEFAKIGGTLCIYMGMTKLVEIVEELLSGGLNESTPIAVINWASMPQQRVLISSLDKVVEAVQKAGLKAPSIIIVGEVVKKAPKIVRHDDRPLSGKRIVITRNEENNLSLRKKLCDLGAEVLEMPLISIKAKHDESVAKEVFAEFYGYEWILFTSANGVRHFMTLFLGKFGDMRGLGMIRIAAIGPATEKALASFYLKADLVPEKAEAEALADALMTEMSVDNLNILAITGNRNRDILVNKLEKNWAIVDTLQVYETDFTDISKLEATTQFKKEGADYILFASSSAAQSFASNAQNLQLEKGASHPQTVSIGPATSATMKEVGMPINIEATKHHVDGLIEAILPKN